jgi:hypothetical protein
MQLWMPCVPCRLLFNARASAKTVDSANGALLIWSPIGSPDAENTHGTVSALRHQIVKAIQMAHCGGNRVMPHRQPEMVPRGLPVMVEKERYPPPVPRGPLADLNQSRTFGKGAPWGAPGPRSPPALP